MPGRLLYGGSRLSFSEPNSLFHFADAREIFIELTLIRGADIEASFCAFSRV